MVRIVTNKGDITVSESDALSITRSVSDGKINIQVNSSVFENINLSELAITKLVIGSKEYAITDQDMVEDLLRGTVNMRISST